MEPIYLAENRYSYIVNASAHINNNLYEVELPETKFEREIQSQLATANLLLMNQKYAAALEKYLYIRGVIAAIIFPKIPVAVAVAIDWASVDIHKLTDSVLLKSADLLKKTPVSEISIPKSFRSSTPNPAINLAALKFDKVGLFDTENETGALIDEALSLVEKNDFKAALISFSKALEIVKDPTIKPALLHDIAIMQERTGNKALALESIKKSSASFSDVKDYEYQAIALNSLAGMQYRNNDQAGATQTLKSITELKTKFNVFPILTGVTATRTSVELTRAITPLTISPLTSNPPAINPLTVNPSTINPLTVNPLTINPATVHPVSGGTSITGLLRAANQANEAVNPEAVQLISYTKFNTRQTQKELGILNKDGSVLSIGLGNNANTSLTAFYEKIKITKDPDFLMGYLKHHTTTIAYFTHIHSWVIPMAIGDCYVAMGSFKEAEKEYLSTLNYKYLNGFIEAVNLWLRLSELYLEWGDRIYRNAGKDIPGFQKALEKYELILKTDNSLNNSSPLYQHAGFAAIKTRVQAIIQAVIINNTVSTENPRMIQVVLEARLQLTKIAGNLNFLGISVETPPFSFEYLQTVARYFCQHAAQVEQMYIQFKSTAENEKLREQQMAQQATLASASVELERRGLTESQEGLNVANASLNYADVQLQNANDSLTSFNNVRWELLELDTLTAWANASAVDRDDQVKLSISGYSYYSADSKRRNVVLKELAAQRTRISHEMEEERLEREIAAADAYKQVSKAQAEQAKARVEVARQRIVIAQTQERFAEENLEFLQGREFNSALWYNLAKQARRFAVKYLDMAIELALMMEIAYEAETGRDLRKIKFEYGLDQLNGLMGAETLLLDIDYFTIDYLRTRARKAQMKVSISLADNYPMAFSTLIQSGKTYFETTLDYFDRRYPGYYLQKVKQVELVLVGLNGSEGVHGTLRNIGVSKFRKKEGNIVNQLFTADVMPLSEYSVRNDAIVFQLDTRELRLFENNGIATMWQLELPLSTNTFPLSQVLDVQMVLFYDGFFDSQLEQQLRATLPTSGTASRGISLQLYAPDELFFLKSQGNAALAIEPAMFPANQKNQVLTNYFIRATGDAAAVANLKLRVHLKALNQDFTCTLDANGNADSTGFTAPLNHTLFDTWDFIIDPADNPHLVQHGKLDLRGLRDLSVFTEFSFDYR